MNQIEKDNYTLKIHENLLKEVIVKKNKTFDAKDVWESRRISEEIKPGVKFFVLIEGEENASVTSESRRAAASAEYSAGTAALALYSNTSYNAIVGNLFLKINRPKVPTRFFDNRDKALEWLKAQMRA